jgi:hypothetical protein
MIGGTDILRSKVLPTIPTDGDTSKATETYRRILEDTRVRVGTLLKADNVSFLLGAGCSLGAGGVSLASIPYETERSLLREGLLGGKAEQWLTLFYGAVGLETGKVWDAGARDKELTSQDPSVLRKAQIPVNYERLLSVLFSWQEALIGSRIEVVGSDGTRVPVTGDVLGELIWRLVRSLVDLCQLPASGKESALEDYRRFIKRALTRQLNLRRVNIATLNYDTLVEQASDQEGVMVIDGFIGNLTRVFRPESFDQDLYFPAQTTEGRVHRLDRVIHLLKLHGSITWSAEVPSASNPRGLFAGTVGPSRKPVVVYPTPLKYGQTLGLPYSEMFRQFALSVVQPQSTLFVMGYSFGDAHVNSLIYQALAIPSFTLVIIGPELKAQVVQRLQESSDERVWLIRGWSIGTFEGFVRDLLPDLRTEEIQERITATQRAINAETT